MVFVSSNVRLAMPTNRMRESDNGDEKGYSGFMIKATLLVILSLSLGLLIGLGIRALAPEVTAQRVINVPTQVISNDPLQTVQKTAEVVISAPRQKAFLTATPKDKNLLCGSLEESRIGGSYRRCEWK